MLTGEMSHRVKNLFAIASALTAIARRSAATTGEMARDITQRLTALGYAHELIRPSLSYQKKAADLSELLCVLLGAYDDKGVTGDRIRISGPSVLVGESSITTVALVIHELATNSIKYGALSAVNGSLDVSFSASDGEVVLVWTEKGGPSVALPRGVAGFGSKLVINSITGQLGGMITFNWPPEGALVTLRMSKARLGA